MRHLYHREGLEGISSGKLQLNNLVFFYLDSVAKVFQTQLSTLHNVSSILYDPRTQRTGTDSVCASSPYIYGFVA